MLQRSFGGACGKAKPEKKSKKRKYAGRTDLEIKDINQNKLQTVTCKTNLEQIPGWVKKHSGSAGFLTGLKASGEWIAAALSDRGIIEHQSALQKPT